MTADLMQQPVAVQLSETEVQLLADRIIDEILQLGQKSISKRKIVKMVESKLQKVPE